MADGSHTSKSLVRVVDGVASRVIALSSLAFIWLGVEKLFPHVFSALGKLISYLDIVFSH
jgi:hypothetical protein